MESTTEVIVLTGQGTRAKNAVQATSWAPTTIPDQNRVS